MACLRGKVFLSPAAAIFIAKLPVEIINLCVVDNFCGYSAFGGEGGLRLVGGCRRGVKGGFFIN